MLEIAQMPQARRLWRICKLFNLPLNDPRIQEMDFYDLSFYEYSIIADDPKKLESLQNHYYDDDYSDWEKEFDESQDKQQAEKQNEKTLKQAEKRALQNLRHEDFEISQPIGEIDDWVKE